MYVYVEQYRVNLCYLWPGWLKLLQLHGGWNLSHFTKQDISLNSLWKKRSLTKKVASSSNALQIMTRGHEKTLHQSNIPSAFVFNCQDIHIAVLILEGSRSTKPWIRCAAFSNHYIILYTSLAFDYKSTPIHFHNECILQYIKLIIPRNAIMINLLMRNWQS